MSFLNINQLYFIIRMLVAGACGFLIGLERKNRSKEAGVRTHFVVACASALMMIISKYGFADTEIGIDGLRGADGARIAAQVVSGIGFLGAGMIFVHRNTVTGLTTAAGIWATSGVGLAIGAGMYAVGISAAVIILAVQIVLHKNFAWLRTARTRTLTIKNVDEGDFQRRFTEALEEKGISVHDVYVKKSGGFSTYVFMVEIPGGIYEDEILALTEYDGTMGEVL